MPSRAIHGQTSFFFMAEEYFTAYEYHAFFICPSLDGHIRCLRILVIVINATRNMGAHVSSLISDLVSLGEAPRSGIAGSHDGSILGF